VKMRAVALACALALAATGADAARLIFANQSTDANRRVYCQLVDATDGMTPETGEAGGQPQVSTNGGAWTDTGIGTLTHIGNGRYYADLTQALVATAETWISVRYKSANTAEGICTSAHVVAFDPGTGAVGSVTGNVGGNVAGSVGSVVGLTASNLDATVSSRASQASVDAVAGYVDTEIAALPTANQISDQVWDEATAGHQAAGSTGLALTSGSAPSAADIWTYGTRTLTTISGTVNILSPTGTTGTLRLTRNDSYYIDDGPIPTFTRTGWVDLTDATEIRLTIRRRPPVAADEDPLLLTVTDREDSRVFGAGEQTVAFEMSAEDTADLVPGANAGKYDIQATFPDGHIRTLETGLVTVIEDQTRPE
jgi:hypothetical protein